MTMPVRPVQAPAGTGITTCSLSMPSKSDDCVDVAVAVRTGGGSRRRLTSRDSLNAAVELWTPAGERVLAVGRPLAALDAGATQALTAQVTGPAMAQACAAVLLHR